MILKCNFFIEIYVFEKQKNKALGSINSRIKSMHTQAIRRVDSEAYGTSILFA